MKLIEKNHNILKYKFNRISYHAVTLIFCIGFIYFLAYLSSMKVLECKYINFDENQCTKTITKPFLPNNKSKIERIDNPQKVDLITKPSKVTYYDIKIINSANDLIFPAYSNKSLAIKIQKELKEYLVEYQETPLVFNVDPSNSFFKATILILCCLTYQFCTPIFITCEANKKNNLIVVTNNYLGLFVKKRKCLITKIKAIEKEKHRKNSFLVYIETKEGKKIKIGTILTKSEAQQLIDRINYFLYSFIN